MWRHPPRRSTTPEELYGLIPEDLRQPLEAREVIARVVDGSVLDEFKPRYGATLVTGFARLFGYPVGILANNGILFSESAQKGAHFIELCCQRGIPLDLSPEHHGLHGRAEVRAWRYRQGRREAGHGRRLRQRAKANGDHRRELRRRQLRHGRPGIRLPVSSGCGPTLGSRSWAVSRPHPCSETVRRDGLEAQGRAWTAAEEEAFKAPIREQYERQGHPYYATARLWDDGIIDPAQTRMVLGLSLSAALNAPIEPTRFGVFRM